MLDIIVIILRLGRYGRADLESDTDNSPEYDIFLDLIDR